MVPQQQVQMMHLQHQQVQMMPVQQQQVQMMPVQQQQVQYVQQQVHLEPVIPSPTSLCSAICTNLCVGIHHGTDTIKMPRICTKLSEYPLASTT